MKISATSSIEEYIAGEEKLAEEQRAQEKIKSQKEATKNNAKEKPEFDWADTEDMKSFYNAMYKAWKKSKQGFSFDNLLEGMGDLMNQASAWLKRKFG